MADNKYLDQNGLLYLWQKIKSKFATQTDLTTTNNNVSNLQSQVDGIVAEGGEPNVIDTVQVNGTALPVTNKTVNVPVPTNNNQLTNGAGYQTAANVTTSIESYGYAPLASPTLTGTPKAPTAASGTNTTQIATTAFVTSAINSLDTGVTSVNGKDGAVTLGASDVGAYTTAQTDTAIESAITIETVKVNGSALTPDAQKAVDVQVPTNNNQLTNGAGYQNASQVATAASNAVTITGIQVNGATQTPANKVVNIAVPTTVAQLSDSGNYALKSDITNMYRFQGSVATYADLPSSGLTAGDVYDVQADGTNYAWTGTAWDALGQIFTITSISNAEIDTIVAS